MRCLKAVQVTTLVLMAGLIDGCSPDGQPEFPNEDKLTPGIFLDSEARAVLPAGMELRPIYDRGLALTKTSEGFRSHLYNDAARYCTIAYGHLVKRAPCNGTEPREFLTGVTEPRGAELLIGDMEQAQIAVLTSVTIDLTDGQYAALCDFVYNVGAGNFKRSTLLKTVNARRHDQVPFQFRRWVKAGGRELPGLVTRREREIKLYFEGVGVPRAAPAEGEDLSPIDIRSGESSP
jgi:GH24 family phage-related lysozyme (muramidase)